MMAKNSKIEWTDHTFNPWIGCQKVSAGCRFCYAERDMTRKPRWANCWGPPETSERLKTKTWNNPIEWNKETEKTRVRPKVFCASLADVFEPNPVVAKWRLELFELIAKTPNLDWLILTKRPKTMAIFFESNNVPDNVWLGVTTENQRTANTRIPILLQIPATVYWISAEPLLELIDFGIWLNRINWIIIGSESGPQRRPIQLEKAQNIVNQCQNASVSVFVKQLPIDGKVSKNLAEWPKQLRVREFPK
jgi:protein gp37